MKMDTSPSPCALLCAMSVGAAIVIGQANNEQESNRPSQTAEEQSEKMTATDAGNAKIWKKTKSGVKGFAQKSYNFGKRITYKTANVSANFIENIGDSLHTIIQ